MEHRIEKIAAFRAVGYKRTYNCQTGENFEKIPLFWQEIMSNGKFNHLMALNNQAPLEATLGICANMRENDFDYYIAVSTDKAIPEEMEEILINEQSYAIFTCPINKIQEITKRIFAEWLPSSEYEHAENAPELEIYPDEEICEIAIPIKKKI